MGKCDMTLFVPPALGETDIYYVEGEYDEQECLVFRFNELRSYLSDILKWCGGLSSTLSDTDGFEPFQFVVERSKFPCAWVEEHGSWETIGFKWLGPYGPLENEFDWRIHGPFNIKAEKGEDSDKITFTIQKHVESSG